MLSMPATFHHSPATSNLFDNPDIEQIPEAGNDCQKLKVTSGDPRGFVQILNQTSSNTSGCGGEEFR